MASYFNSNPLINLLFRCGHLAVYAWVNWKKKCLWLAKDEIARFLTLTLQNKCKSTQKIYFNGYHLLFKTVLVCRGLKQLFKHFTTHPLLPLNHQCGRCLIYICRGLWLGCRYICQSRGRILSWGWLESQKLLLVNNGRLLDPKIRVPNKNSSTSKRSGCEVLAESAERLA